MPFAFLYGKMIELKLKLHLIDLDEVEDLIYRSLLRKFSFYNLGAQVQQPRRRRKRERYRKMKHSLSAMISGLFQVI